MGNSDRRGSGFVKLVLGNYTYPDITTSFLEISNRFIPSTLADYTGPYDVSETQIGLSGSYKIYIGVKVTASPTYVNDIALPDPEKVEPSTGAGLPS